MPRTRANGEGAYIHRPDGRWEARLTLPNGRRKSVYAKTRAEAKRKADEIQRLASQSVDVFSPQQTLEQYLDHWLADVARHAVRPTTFESYERVIRVRILPTLGHLKLRTITPQHIQALYSELLDKRRLSPGSVLRTHAVFHSAFKQALRWDLISRNPCDAVRAPRVTRNELNALDRD